MIRHETAARAVAFAAVMLPGLVIADGAPRSVELTPFAGYSFGGTFDVTDSDQSVELDDAQRLGLILDIRKDDNTQWEVLYDRQDTDANAVIVGAPNPNFDLSIQALQIGGTYQWEGDALRPYMAATIGGTKMDATDNGYGSDTFFSFSLGLGLQYRPLDSFGLRLEWRTFGTVMNSKTDLFCSTGGATNSCLIQVQGHVLWQTGAFAGLVFRF